MTTRGDKIGRLIYGDITFGFPLFYELIHNRTIPQHAKDWIKHWKAAYDAGKGIVIEAFRGSTKTATLNTFVAYMTGRNPQGSSLIIKSGEESADRSSKEVAYIIEHNPMWKKLFPHVVPDKDKGWGAQGYYVKDARMDYGDWTRSVIGPDPSFVALTYNSKAILGMHPSNVLGIDDIHTRDNVESDRMRASVIEAITSTIFPTRSPHDPWTLFVGTPWREDDALQKVKATGAYVSLRTPVYTDGKPTWDFFGEERIEQERQQDISGGIDFARMYLLDLEAAKGIELKREWLHEFDAETIKETWPVVMGIDYASVADELKDRDRDYFALAVGKITPTNGVVLVDGFRGHVSQGEAELLVRSWASKYPHLALICVEAIGKGEEFYHLLLRQSGVGKYILPGKTGRKSKGQRFQRQLAPTFQLSRAWISSLQTPFIQNFIDEWISWPNGRYDDAIDAVYYMVMAADQLVDISPAGEREPMDDWRLPRERQPNPWQAFCKR